MTAAIVFVDIGRVGRQASLMFWETLWPLVLGFCLSGVVQAFAPRERIERNLGDHGTGAIARATGLGMISSSCSYSAAAMAKSLFQKGADLITAMVFMFASTNLVIEIGIVLVVLMGWQFAAAEFVGGPIMIVLLALFGSFVLNRGMVSTARKRMSPSAVAGSGQVATRGERDAHGPIVEVNASITKARISEQSVHAARFALSDLKMLRREIVIGYLVAGALSVLVPNELWNDLFIHGHGGWTVVENAVVGPVIAFLSCVCSIGNVPMAAALWRGGIAFGGVVSFLFADLLAAPLVLVYRRYYGGRLTLRLVALFWAIMSFTGVIVGELASFAHLVPDHRRGVIVTSAFHWNYTTFLDIAFIGVLAYIYRLSHSQSVGVSRASYALDPVCGMQVRTADAPATLESRGHRFFFCSDTCADRFDLESVQTVDSSAFKS